MLRTHVYRHHVSKFSDLVPMLFPFQTRTLYAFLHDELPVGMTKSDLIINISLSTRLFRRGMAFNVLYLKKVGY